MKYCLALSVLVLTPLVVQAQGIEAGFEIGASYVSLPYDDPHPDWEPGGRPSYSAMVFTQIPFASFLSIQPGFRYSRFGNDVGYDFTVEVGPEDERVKGHFMITQQYVSLPVRLRYQVRRSPFYVVAGPEVGYLISARTDDEQELPNPSERGESITDQMRRVNVAVVGGAGATVPRTGQHLYVQVLYGRGITGTATSDWLTNWKTQEISLSIGYLF